MMMREPAALTEALLVVKGAAAPLMPPPQPRPRARPRRDDLRRRISLRLDSAQHLRLRLAAAHQGKNLHAVLLEALDHYLARIVPGTVEPGCGCLRGPAPDNVAVMPIRAP